MELRDRDLISIQEVRDLVLRAARAQTRFGAFSQKLIDAVVEACATAAEQSAETLARRAVDETGFGNVPDKITKNQLASIHVWQAIRHMRTVGILREDRDKGILEVASPVGVLAAVVPSTNPTSTAIYKTLIALKAGNAIVFSPHPSAVRAICETAAVLSRAAAAAGAPDGLIGCLQHATLAGTRELMGHRDVGLILATGGTALVRAAYSSGKPAYGVGPGNVPAFVERTADVRKAVGDIFAGKTFDYGTVCSSEQAIVAEEHVLDSVLDESRKQGAHFLSPEEAKRIGDLLFSPGTHTPNTSIVGRHATVIAEMAGMKIPAATRVLIARLEPAQIGREHPLSAEKLSPILALYAVPNLASGIELCTKLLQYGGLGHTASIHSQSEAAVKQFGQAVPAFRICVNTSSVHGSIGYSTNLFPAMTLGCGAPGGNITSDNIGPMHLLNIKRVAWESRAVEHRTVPANGRMGAEVPLGEVPKAAKAAAGALQSGTTIPLRMDTGRIAEAVQKVLSDHGIARGALAAGAKPGNPVAPVSESSVSNIASEIASRFFGEPPRASAKSSGPKVNPTDATCSSTPSAESAGPGASAAPVPLVPPAAPPTQVVPFVSENDVRRAIFRSEKIHIGPKTIVTPSARDLGVAHEVFIEITR